MQHIGVGAEHARAQVLKLVDSHHIRIIDAATGELLRELILDPSRDYQPSADHPDPAGNHKAGPRLGVRSVRDLLRSQRR